MALETMVTEQDPFGYVCRDFYAALCGGGAVGWRYDEEDEDKAQVWDSSSSSVMQSHVKECWDPNSSPEAEACTAGDNPTTVETPVVGRRKRRRTKSSKNKEELENQRMTHIAVERNRRKQMNEYLAMIRSLMPASYVQRGDQASIIGGAINFVKELEQLLQTLEVHKTTTTTQQLNNGSSSPLFADFFTFPQYSMYNSSIAKEATTAENRSALADIEVTMAESHANLKILSKRRPRQLLNVVAGLQCLRLTVLHLNVTTTLDQMVLYSLSVKIEDGCQMSTVDEIADAVNHLLARIEEEAALS